MQLGTRSKYAVAAMVDLSLMPEGQTVCLRDIAEKQGVPQLYLEQLFIPLRKRGFLASVRGAKGGYFLKKKPSYVAVADVIEALEERIKVTRCKNNQKGCLPNSKKCRVHHLWANLESKIWSYFEGITLEDVANGSFEPVSLKTSLSMSFKPAPAQHVTHAISPSPIYLDYNAYAPQRPDVTAHMRENLKICANPSALHTLGQQERLKITHAREKIMEQLSLKDGQLIFTSGGTESNNLALQGLPQIASLIISAGEHDSVLKPALFLKEKSRVRLGICPLNSHGTLDLNHLKTLLKGIRKPFLCSVFYAHGETGAINPISEIAQHVHACGGILHVDAAQVLGKTEVNLSDCDMVTLSSHKCGGPSGVGALFVKNSIKLTPLFYGGNQEEGLRPGTENVSLIQGFAKAIALACQETQERVPLMQTWQKRLTQKIRTHVPNAHVFAESAKRLSNTLYITMPGVDSTLQVMAFDLEGVSVSTGSACSSGTHQASRALLSMGISESVARTALRISFGWNTHEADIERFTALWIEIYNKLRKESFYASSAPAAETPHLS
jgi:cysteine desulfurase